MARSRQFSTNAERQAAYRRRQTEASQRSFASSLPPLPGIATLPGSARWGRAVALVRRVLHVVTLEMDLYYNDRSLEWQESERGEQFLERLELLQQIEEQLEAWES